MPETLKSVSELEMSELEDSANREIAGTVSPTVATGERADEDAGPIRLNGFPGAGDRSPAGRPPMTGSFGAGMAVAAAYSAGLGAPDSAIADPSEDGADPDGAGPDREDADEGATGGQLSWDWGEESASVRGRCVLACRPPPVRLSGSGAPIALIRPGTWLGSTT
jgi:hypothetical protein